MSRTRQLILSPLTNKWILSTRPHPLALNRSLRHPPSSSAPPPSTPPQPFETLATKPVSASLQAPQESVGTREGFPIAGQVAVELSQKKVKKTIHGIAIPERPPPPAEGECCMSGCAHCVYDIYMSDIEIYHDQLAEARKALLKVIKQRSGRFEKSEWPAELGEMEESKGRHGGDAKEEAEREWESRMANLKDPSLRAFLEMERKMKKKQEQRQHEPG